MTRPFVIFALPRSRTAWTSAFLTYGGRDVRHDTGIGCERLEDFKANFDNGMAGCVETGSIIAWRAIRQMMPHAKFAAIIRPVSEIYESLGKFGIVPIEGEMEHRHSLLRQMIEAEKCPVFSFHDLTDYRVRRELFEFCLETTFDAIWDANMAEVNIQVDMPARIQLLIQNHKKIEALKASLLERGAA